VLNCSSNDFMKELEKCLKDSSPIIYFSAQGGELPGRIFDMMPPKSEMVVLGSLYGGKDLILHSRDFYF